MNSMKTKTTEIFPLIIKKAHSTVKIYRGENRGKPFFTVAYLTASGRKRENFTDLAEAKRTAASRVDALAKGDLEALKLGGQERQLYVAAAAALEASGVSIDIAARTFAVAFDLLGGDSIIEACRYFAKHRDRGLPDITVADASERFVEAKIAEGLSARHCKDLRRITGKLVQAFAVNLKDVTGEDLSRYIAGLKMGAVSKNNHLRNIKTLFSFARSHGWLTKNETTAADAVNFVKTKRKPPAIFTPAETAALLSAASERFIPYIALLAFGGVRADEISEDEPRPGEERGQLRWEDIDFDRGVINVPEAVSKTIRRKIVMQANLAQWLAPYRGRTGFIYALEPSNDREKCAAAAKVKWKHNALRHGFASYRLEQCKNAAEVSLEMGNSPRMVMQRYADVVHAEDAAAYWSIRPADGGKVLPTTAAA
jgi:integrase